MADKSTPVKRPAAATKAPARGRAIPLETRAQAEEVARWVEGLFARYPDLVFREQGWLAAHPDDKEAQGRVAYYRNALAVAKQIAYYLRSHRVRGLTTDS